MNYRKLRLSNITSPEYRHVLLLLYWPIYLLGFFAIEHLYQPTFFQPTYCFLDDMIPFNELFVIPYCSWFLFLVGIQLYTILYDVETFKKFVIFVMITYSVSVLTYVVYPTCQNLRPTEFERDNIFTQLVKMLYSIDTNTNVCPSIHVIGALAVMFAGLKAKGLQTTFWRLFFIISALLICLSTMYIKQHSAVDVIFAIPVSVIGYIIVFRKRGEKV